MDTEITNDYSIGAEIGRGTFGRVYKAEHEVTKEPVALKKIDLSKCAKKDKDRMYQEIQILRKCHHDNLVKYKDSFTMKEGRFLYIVMELCQVGNLRKFIQAENGLDETTCITVLQHVSSGLHYLHQRDIIHRDIKTTNIFLTKENGEMRTKIGDFGLARFMDVSTIPTFTVGSPYFMSPEMIDQKPYGKPTDIWSLGCCAYEMATTNIPFEASMIDSLRQKITNGEVVLQDVRYCDDVKQLVQKMMSRSDEERPTVSDILETLSSHKHGASSSSRTTDSKRTRIRRKKSYFSKTWGPETKVHTSTDVSSRESSTESETTTSTESQAEAPVMHGIYVRVQMTEQEKNDYKFAQQFDQTIRQQLGKNSDKLMNRINEVLRETKNMDDDSVFMRKIEKILDPAVLEKCKKYLRSLWMYKVEILRKNYTIDF